MRRDKVAESGPVDVVRGAMRGGSRGLERNFLDRPAVLAQVTQLQGQRGTSDEASRVNMLMPKTHIAARLTAGPGSDRAGARSTRAAFRGTPPLFAPASYGVQRSPVLRSLRLFQRSRRGLSEPRGRYRGAARPPT